MSDAKFVLSLFGDEIADDLDEQIDVMNTLNIRHLELRGVWGKNVIRLTDAEAATVRQKCDDAGIRISCIGSPVGKSPLKALLRTELDNLRRIFQIANIVGTRLVRVFSFFPPDTSTNRHYNVHVAEAANRLAALTGEAERAGMQLVLENEHAIVGDTVERCARLLDAVNSPTLRFAWDPANFVTVGEANSVEKGWVRLRHYVAHVHIKDALLETGKVLPAGEGDGQIGLLLEHLREAGYQGYLALEPHLAIAGPSGGFSGPDGMARAATALRSLMAEHQCVESDSLS